MVTTFKDGTPLPEPKPFAVGTEPVGSLFWFGFEDGYKTALQRVASGESAEQLLESMQMTPVSVSRPGIYDLEFMEHVKTHVEAQLLANARYVGIFMHDYKNEVFPIEAASMAEAVERGIDIMLLKLHTAYSCTNEGPVDAAQEIAKCLTIEQLMGGVTFGVTLNDQLIDRAEAVFDARDAELEAFNLRRAYDTYISDRSKLEPDLPLPTFEALRPLLAERRRFMRATTSY